MSPISTRKNNLICKRRKLNDNDLLIPLDESSRRVKRTYSNNFTVSSDGKLSLGNDLECSLSNTNCKLFANCSCARDICICVLRDHDHDILLNSKKEKEISKKEINRRIHNSSNEMRSLKCKSCSAIGHSTKMLICDNCESPFHLKCSGVLSKKVFPEEWYCSPCSRTKNKRALKKVNLRSRELIKGDKHLIEEDLPKYNSSVRIGEAFQAEVQEWFGPVHDDDSYYEEVKEIKYEEFGNLNVQDSNTTHRYCNWIQCRQETNGTVCGKWRRAPFFEIQTNNWDCSCSVLWDPFCADCAVPQELDTREVMKHLEYVNSLRNRLARQNHLKA